MKQFYLLALFCAVGLMCVFTACDDDDKAATWPDGSEISALYENKSTSLPESNKLMLTYSGGELIGKGVYLKAEEHTLVLYNVFPAEKETFIYNVPLTAVADGYTFAGSSTTTAGATFDYAGKVMPGVMVLNLTNVVMPENTMMGQWKLSKRNPLQIKWEVEPFEMEGQENLVTSETTQGLADMIGGILSMPMMLPSLVNVIEFQSDGNIRAEYKGLADTKWKQSPINLCKYNVRNNEVAVLLELQMILKMIQSSQTEDGTKAVINQETSANKKSLSTEEVKALVSLLLTWGQEGIPLTMSKDGKMQLTLGKEQLLPLMPLIPILIESLGNSDNMLLNIIYQMREQIVPMFEHTTVFEVTLSLDPVTAGN